MGNIITQAANGVRARVVDRVVKREFGDIRNQLSELSEALALSQTRADGYRFAVIGDSFLPSEDYTQGDYRRLDDIYLGRADTGMQLGALFAQPIVGMYSALEMAVLPKFVVRQRSKTGGSTAGNPVEEMSIFLNDQMSLNHATLLEGSEGKHVYADTYVVFGPDRKLEAITPYPTMCSPGFHLFGDGIHNFRSSVQRIVQNPKTGEKKRVNIRRYWDAERIVYEAVPDEQGVNLTDFTDTPKLEIPHMLGSCPVALLANNRKPGAIFGYSQFANVIPFMNIYHNVLVRGFEAQQYSGKPILMIHGIPGQVKTWLMKTFGMDVTKTKEAEQKSTMMEFFKMHKFFAFADTVKAEFIESKYPIGATSEVAKLAFDCMVKISGVPEFMFGSAMEGSNAIVREQYTPLKARLKRKQREWEPTLRQIARWILLGFSTMNGNDPTTGLPMPTYGFITNPEKLDDYVIDIVWPPMLNSDEDIKLQVLELMQTAGAVSFRTLHDNYREYVSDSELEFARIKEENKDEELKPPEPVAGNPNDGGDVSGAKRRRAQRGNDDKGNNGNNSGKTGRGTK